MADSVMSMATSTDYSDAGNNMPPESWASEFSRGSDEGDEMVSLGMTLLTSAHCIDRVAVDKPPAYRHFVCCSFPSI